MKLSPAAVGKHFTLLSPFCGRFVRTGTIGDGSCFFHSVLSATDPSYLKASPEEKKEIVKSLRKEIVKMITVEYWKKKYCNKSSFVTISQLFWAFFKVYFYAITKNDITNTKHIQSILDTVPKKFSKDIFEVFPEDRFQQIIESSYNDFEKNQREGKNTEFKQILLKNTNTRMRHYFLILAAHHNFKLGENRIVFYIKHVQNLFVKLYTLAEEKTYLLFIKTLENCDNWITQDKLELLSDFFKLDIYFMDSNTRLPYNVGGTEHYKKRQSIIILYLNNNHFETIGIYMGKKNINRLFSFEDPIIKKFYTFLCNPEEFSKEFPVLKRHLPQASISNKSI